MNFGTISPREIDSYLFKPDYILIDIRTPRDFRRQHIKGAVCIPYEDLQERVRLLRHKRLPGLDPGGRHPVLQRPESGTLLEIQPRHGAEKSLTAGKGHIKINYKWMTAGAGANNQKRLPSN